MNINIETDQRTEVKLSVNGRLQAEIGASYCQTRDTLEQELLAARCLQSLPRVFRNAFAKLQNIDSIADHINTTKAARQNAFCRGLLDGLERKTLPHMMGVAGVPPILPNSTASYRVGYEYGECFAKILDAVDAVEPALPT